MNNKENIVKLEESLGRLNDKESVIYFLTYDTKNNARASVKHIYDIALTLKENGYNSKILVEDEKYTGIENWLGDTYKQLDVISIKVDKPELKIDDTIVVPEYFSNVLPQLSNMKCIKVLLVQQIEYMYETLPIGSRFSDYGFDKIITTSESAKKYLNQIFPESLVFIIPPIISDNFKPITLPLKPFVAINCRDRVVHRKLISEFYLKYPQLRWITFRDMIQMSYEDFAHNLKECMVALWVDNESTFGTFPLECMKCNVPVVGKIPNTEPDWLSENGIWTYDINKLVDNLANYILAFIDGVELTDEVIQKMKDTLLPYDTSITKKNIVSIFMSLINKRVDAVQKALENLKQEENI
jgi:hypothetical protein